MKKCLVLIAVILCVGADTVSAQLSSMVESFSGSGPHNGFDEANWVGTVARDPLFRDGSLSIEVPTQSDAYLYRALQGFGPFKTSLQLSRLYIDPLAPELNDGADAFGSISIAQLWETPSGHTGGIIASVSTTTQAEGWWMTFGSEPVMKQVPVASGPVLMEIEFDGVDMHFSYDGNTLDSESPTVVTIPFDNAPSETVRHEISISATVWQNGGPVIAELDSLVVRGTEAEAGDFSGNGELGVDDLNLLARAIEVGSSEFDLDGNEQLDTNDLYHWVRVLKKTYLGDANLDGQFDSADLIQVFASGQYESSTPGASWTTGDWNSDGQFGTADLIIAFQDGGYDQGPGRNPIQVPEPRSFWAGLFGFTLPWIRSSLRIRRV